MVSYYETTGRPPKNSALVACEIIFNVRIAHLFPAVYDELLKQTRARAAKLLESMAHKGERHPKTASLRALIERLDALQHEV
jgi:hypothetical protein